VTGAIDRRPACRLIGIGNEYRGDDAAGLIIARRLIPLQFPGLEIIQHLGDGAELMELWRDASEIVVVDAVRSGAAPGTIFRIDAVRERVAVEFFSYSTHAFSLAEAVELSRQLGQLPRSLYIYGIEGANFSPGERISAPVEGAIESLMAELQLRFRTSR